MGGYSVFGNPALPVPEHPKAEHPIQNQNFLTEQIVNCVRNKHGNIPNPWETPESRVFTTLKIPLQRQRENFLSLEKRSYIRKE